MSEEAQHVFSARSRRVSQARGQSSGKLDLVESEVGTQGARRAIHRWFNLSGACLPAVPRANEFGEARLGWQRQERMREQNMQVCHREQRTRGR